MNVVFTAALFSATAAIAVWLRVRAPRLTSVSFVPAVIVAALSIESLSVLPVWNDSYAGLYASIFGGVFPLLLVVWLSMLAVLAKLRP